MKLETLLSQKGLVLQSPSVDKIRDRANSLNSSNEPIKLFYGETYDNYGHTIDSMKYYFFVSMLSQSLKREGYKTNPIIVVADVAACRNVSKSLNVEYIELGEKRAEFVHKVKEIYNLDLNVIKMGDYLFSKEFQDKLEKIVSICKENPLFIEKIEKTVPESKIEIERKKGFAYSFDEIGTIIDLDVKVGPPREDLYDDVTRDIAKIQGKKELMSLFLTPTFPLGKNWAYFFAHEGIEEYGITAYKAGSKQLQDHRIIIGKTIIEEARCLLEKSFISKNPELPNPCLDIGIIAEMAKINLENKNSENNTEFNKIYDEFYFGNLSEEELKNYVIKSLNKYILSKFENG